MELTANATRQRVAEHPDLKQAKGFSELKQKLAGRAVVIDDETYYVVESDLLLDEDELAFRADLLNALDKANGREPGLNVQLTTASSEPLPQLVGISNGNRIVRWDKAKVLNYCVLRKTFMNDNEYQVVVDSLQKATRDWEETCGVEFEHFRDLDGGNVDDDLPVLFKVRYFNAGGKFIASAFFPDDPPHKRRVLVDPSYFDSNFDKAGIFRHELGHVLGFRHEHLRPEAPGDCPDEDPANTIDLTQYDPKSCMHYLCGGITETALAISVLDRHAAQMVYGLPLTSFDYIV